MLEFAFGTRSDDDRRAIGLIGGAPGERGQVVSAIESAGIRTEACWRHPDLPSHAAVQFTVRADRFHEALSVLKSCGLMQYECPDITSPPPLRLA
jgi:hypothetical protein